MASRNNIRERNGSEVGRTSDFGESNGIFDLYKALVTEIGLRLIPGLSHYSYLKVRALLGNPTGSRDDIMYPIVAECFRVAKTEAGTKESVFFRYSNCVAEIDSRTYIEQEFYKSLKSEAEREIGERISSLDILVEDGSLIFKKK